jgi:hypothetical protein
MRVEDIIGSKGRKLHFDDAMGKNGWLEDQLSSGADIRISRCEWN